MTKYFVTNNLPDNTVPKPDPASPNRVMISKIKMMFCKDCGYGPLAWWKLDVGWRLLNVYDDPTTQLPYANTAHRHKCKPRYWQ